MVTKLNTHFHLVLGLNVCATVPSLIGLTSAGILGGTNAALPPATFFYLRNSLAADLNRSK